MAMSKPSPVRGSGQLDRHNGQRAHLRGPRRKNGPNRTEKHKVTRGKFGPGHTEFEAGRAGRGRGRFWPTGWWSIVDFKIGIVPLPVFVILLAVIALYALTGSVPSDILMAIVLLSMGGFACAELGKRIPIIRNIGAAAIFATFIPSFLAFHHLLPNSILGSVVEFTKNSNFLYLFISCIIVGSALST